MDEIGTIRAGISSLDPYMHGYIGVQIAEPLYINIRQSAEISSIKSGAEQLYPSIDLKLRLLKESAYRPEVSIGLQSIIGHKMLASEYIALSKAYKSFDFTAGIGWGRMGSAGKIRNPFKSISSHFGKNRDPSNETPNAPSDWFSGDFIDIFGGVEYFTPVKGLSLKLDYGADSYAREKLDSDYNPASPWGFGASYKHNKWFGANIGIQGKDKVFAQIYLHATPSKWPFTHKKYSKPKAFYMLRTDNLNTAAMKQDAENDDIDISNITTSGQIIYADLELSPKAPAPQQIGRAARHISMHSGLDIEKISITPTYQNLRASNVNIMRKDVENSVNNSNSSPQEIWKNTEFAVTDNKTAQSGFFLSTKGINNKRTFTLSLENQFSLSEEDSGILYRSSAIIETRSSPFLGFITGSALRLNLADNLDKLEKLRPTAANPVRSNIYDFTRKRINIENTYLSYTHSFTDEIHAAATAGYLEEFYAGYGGEILYRPFKSRLAFGAEIWNISRRNPFTPLNLGLSDASIISGHVNGWYDIPNQNMTLSAKVGRFLAGDSGISLGLGKSFNNGAKIIATTTLSNYSEPDLFGGTTSAYHSINLSLPIGSISYIPQGSEIRNKTAPFGRDIGQTLNKPIDLFEITESFTLDHMADNWLDIME